jgi:hypothetical protein
MVAQMVQDTAGNPPETAAGSQGRFRRRTAPLDWRERLSRQPGWWLIGAAVVTAALWLSHMPDLLFHAQFYADDGGWYQSAYNLGPVISLAHPAAGYLVLLQRVVASFSLLLPTVAVPTFFNVAALAVELVGICYLVSRRMLSAIPSLKIRVAIALLVLALPNAYDTSGNLTNAQWHLGLIAFLVMFADPPRHVAGHILDALIILGSGLTGPYCILLEPVIWWRWRRHRDDRRLRNILIANSVCAVVQILVIIDRFGAERVAGPLAAGLYPLVRMIGRQVTLGLIVGAHGLTQIAGSFAASNGLALALLAVIPLAVCAWAAWHGPTILRALCYFAFVELALAVAAPSIAGARWPSLGNPADIVHFHPGGIRYFLFPLLAFAISLGWMVVHYGVPWMQQVRHRPNAGAMRPAGSRAWIGRIVAVAAAAVLLSSALIGVRVDWTYPPYLEEHWGAEVSRLQTAKKGTVVVIPINPRGWTLQLTAR